MMLLAAAAAVLAAAAGATLRADALMLRRDLSHLEQAMKLYNEALEHEPDNVELKLKLADAMNGVMRVKTHANTIVIDKLLDTPEHKAIWGRMGPRALELATSVQKARPNDVRAAAVYADAYMFSCSAKGIIKQALAGAAKVFKANAERLIKLDRKYDSGVGYALLGCFYAVAPWPYGNLDEAAKQLEKALGVARSQRNAYYVAVVAYKRGEYDKAAQHFRMAQSARPGSLSEQDFSGFMLSESKRALALAEAELAASCDADTKGSQGKRRRR